MDYKVKIGKIYEGPIAYLYELIKASKIDIYDIPISEITEAYLKYISMLQKLDIEIASEFLVWAAKLLYIKSMFLLPQNKNSHDDADLNDDPRTELIEKLLEYQKFREAAKVLEDKEVAQNDLIFREKKQLIFDYHDEDNWIDISIYDLINAFNNIIEYVEPPLFDQLVPEEVTSAMKIKEIMEKLKSDEKFFFGELFPDKVTRYEIIATFQAILELVKAKKIRIQQHKLFGDIRIIRR